MEDSFLQSLTEDPEPALLSFKSGKSLKKKQAFQDNSANLYAISDAKSESEDAVLLPAQSVKKSENFLLMTGKFNFADFAAFDIMLQSESEADPLSRSAVTKLQSKPSTKGVGSVITYDVSESDSKKKLTQSSPMAPKSSALTASTSPKRPNNSSPKLTAQRMSNELSEFTRLHSHIAKEFFFLGHCFVPGLKPVVRVNEETVLQSIDTQFLTIYSRPLECPEAQTGFSLLATLKETSSYPKEDKLDEYFYFYFANEKEREKFVFLNTPNSVRAHWIVHDPSIDALKSTRSTILLYSIITYTVIGDTMLFLETSPAPTLRNSYIELPVSNFLLTDQVKSGDLTPLFSLSASRKNATQKKILDSNKIKQYIAETWGCSPITIPDTKEVVESLMKIERHKRAVLKNISVGVLYRKAGQSTRDDITSNKEPSKKFDDFMKCCGYNPDVAATVKRNISVTWYLSTLLDEDGVRQKIGNSMFIIIFNDANEPFNPTHLYLGKLSIVVCVVRPVKAASISSALQYQISFYFCYDSNIVLNDLSSAMKQIELFNFEPQLPPEFVFTSSNVFDFILAKFTNCLSQILNYHPSFGCQYYTPIAHLVEKVVQENASSYHQRNLEAAKKRKKNY